MNIRTLILFCSVLLVASLGTATVASPFIEDGPWINDNNAGNTKGSDECCAFNSTGNCCTYGSCCGSSCCGKDDQCFNNNKCVYTAGLSKTVAIVLTVIVVVIVLAIIISVIACCCCCCCKKGSSKRYPTSSNESRSSSTTTTTTTAARNDVELEEGKGKTGTEETPEAKEKTPEEIEAEQKREEFKKKFNAIRKPIVEILDVYTMDKTPLENATEMMIWVVMRPYLGIQAGDQAAVAAYTDSGKEFFEGLYAKFYKKVSDKDRNAFLASVFENVAEKRTELESVCEGGNFVAALGPVAKALKATAGLVKTTALTQDHAVLIIGAMLATVFTALKVTENKDSDQQAFSDWFDSLKMYLPDEHASFLKSASWETAFESLDD